MIGKAALRKMGFDRIDRQRDYATFLNNLRFENDNASSSFKDAYALGIGMILQFNTYYLLSCS